MNFASTRLLPVIVLGLIACAPNALAGFLEMPDTTEVPEMERESLLKDLDIPSVRERDPDPMAGPRLNVTQFRVQGIVEYPELGITRESLNKLVEGIRFEMMSEGELLESGYTLDEVGEISDLIAEIEEKKRQVHVGPEEVQRLVFLIREQRQRRGVTLGMIETVADTITRYYRERGFILAKAYIPQQRVRDGIVNLTLLLGNLGEVNVLNNKRYRAGTLEKVFAPALGEPITASGIESRLFQINDLPGMSAQAYFEPGSQVGDTKLNVNVVNEESFNGNVRIDNHGSINTGKYRLYTDGYWHNPGRYGDQLHIGVLATFEPSDSLYGSLHYRLPLFSPRLNLSLGGSTNDFVTNSSAFVLSGKSQVLDAALTYALKRSRVENYGLELRYADIKTDIQDATVRREDQESSLLDPVPVDPNSDVNFDLNEDFDSEVRNLDLVFNFDKLQEKHRSLHQGSVRLTYGDFVVGREEGQEENPIIFGFNYSLLKFLPVPFTDADSRVLAKVSGQYTKESVSSVNQMALAGPNRMRGFAINSFNSDRTLYLGADWIFNGPGLWGARLAGQPLSEMIQPFLFVDMGYGHSKSAALEGEPVRASLADAGVGLRLSFKDLRTSFTYAQALHYEPDTGAKEERSLDDLTDRRQVYFDLLYSF